MPLIKRLNLRCHSGGKLSHASIIASEKMERNCAEFLGSSIYTILFSMDIQYGHHLQTVRSLTIIIDLP